MLASLAETDRAYVEDRLRNRFPRYQVTTKQNLKTMNTCLVGPEEGAPCLGQGKPVPEHAPLAGHQKSRTPAATPVEEPNVYYFCRRYGSPTWPSEPGAVALSRHGELQARRNHLKRRTSC
jgi:hypothetical protein